MKKLITIFAVGALAAGGAFAEKGEKKEGGDKPKHAEGGEKGKGDKGGERKGPGGMLKSLDADKSGDISFDEFKAGPRAKDKPEEEVKKHFDKMDKDGDGKISAADLEAIAKEMKEKGKGRGDKGGEKGKGDKKGGDKGGDEGGDKKGE